MSLADWAEDRASEAPTSPRPGVDFGEWSRAQGAEVDAALARLRELPLAPGKTRHVLHPFGFVDRAFIKQQFPHEVLRAAVDLAPVVDVPLAHVVGIQHSVTTATVAQYIVDGEQAADGLRSPEHGGLIDHPICIRCDGVNVWWDGHNRGTAAWCLGRETEPARFADLDDPAFMQRVYELVGQRQSGLASTTDAGRDQAEAVEGEHGPRAGIE